MMTQSEGLVDVEPTNGRWILDAEPYVMIRARKLFAQATPLYCAGKHTHAPLSLAPTPETAADLAWLSERYKIVFETSVSTQLKSLKEQYERLTEIASADSALLLWSRSDQSLAPAYPPREHQTQFAAYLSQVRRTLLADPIGSGKTESALLCAVEPEQRPAVVVCQAHLVRQWKERIERFLPDAYVEIASRWTSISAMADFIVVSYHAISGQVDELRAIGIKTAIFDECQELRHTGTNKRNAARQISLNAERVVGASATPIYNMGNEIWSVIDVLFPDSLGPSSDFTREWCSFSGKVSEPDALGSYLRKRGLLVRRDVRYTGSVSREVITIDTDLDSLVAMKDTMKALALSVLSGRVGESAEASRELDWKLRQATGVAKARTAAEFVAKLVDGGEQVILAGWHREVYRIWDDHFRKHHVTFGFITGSESPAQKEATKQAFIEGKIRVLVLSLRSGAGIDGLQNVCSTVVFGELDWSPHVMDQVIGRVSREGQTRPVTATFLTIDDGSDPFIVRLLGLKRQQHIGIVSDDEILDAPIVDAPLDRMRDMALEYLEQIGVEAPAPVVYDGLMGEVLDIIRAVRVPMTTEVEMQRVLFEKLAALNAHVIREHRISARSRIDFLITRELESVGIECKVTQTDRSSVYAQVRRYAQEGIHKIILVAPWSGIDHLHVDDSLVVVVDPGKLSL